ncbi:SDR family oxidoreductase [Bacillus sp. FJAT-49711]|uniref:SDR family NAD(P)-dependent oxidoreductase n=1 Tax=Bacillus sp. FJAT-49711 TaxID=2833585 RepID=UPI001BC95030|nr:SDR family oxidoreductase [Bacillus sp. FJAT-49711]MBS4219296.1 SDR family oxidoreductase [Bacillus sp. FJAT-49711]
MKFKDKLVFITDADHDSGKTLLNHFASEGAHFLLNSASNGDAIESNLESCKSKGSKTVVANIDLCNERELSQLLVTIEKQLGSVDILIHNNNFIIPTKVETCTEELFLQVMNSNAKSAFVCTQVVGKQMVKKQSGKVIFISSIHAEKPTGSSFVYSASRGAVKLLCSESALNLGRHGINVNSIEMGPIVGDNEKFKSNISSIYEAYQYKVPNAILGDFQDLAHLTLFLSSDESRYINGTDIRLDGGFLLHYMDHKMKVPVTKVNSEV